MKPYLYWTLRVILKRVRSRYKCLGWQRPTLCYVYICMAMFIMYWASPVAQIVKNLPAMQGSWVWSLVGEDPWRREWLLTPVICLENSMNRGAWWAAVHRVANSRTWWVTNTYLASYLYILIRQSQLGWHLSILLMIMWKQSILF